MKIYHLRLLKTINHFKKDKTYQGIKNNNILLVRDDLDRQRIFYFDINDDAYKNRAVSNCWRIIGVDLTNNKRGVS